MCVLLCANPSVREWLDIPQARAYRLSLHLCAVCTNAFDLSVSSQQHESLPLSDFEFDEAEQRRLMNRSTWLQAYCSYHSQLAQRNRHLTEHDPSARNWPKALDAIAKTWGRILSLVGLRR
jgi:hypothetical protein